MEYSLNLKKGWNITYEKKVENGNTVTIEETTTAPVGAKWYFEEITNDDDDNGSIPNNTLTVAVENGNSYNERIDTVKLEIYVNANANVDGVQGYQTFAVAEYKNGGFTLALPESVDSRYLFSSKEEDTPDGVTISNVNVKTVEAENLHVYKSGTRTGYLKLKSGDWKGWLMYVDGDVFITGTGIYPDRENRFTYPITIKYSLNLKRGWNIVYQKEPENYWEMTTTAPAGAKWYFDPYSG
jgi:predicted  nucleic acid-binding Zn-ribbon protein